MRDVTEAVFMLVLATVWLVSVPDEKDEPRVNGRVDVPVGNIDDVTPVAGAIDVSVAVLVAELLTA